MDTIFVQKLSELLARPGGNATSGMGFFRAAVLIPLIQIGNEPAILFEVRASQLNWQPGEICFPGGRIEESDTDARAAAVRETTEELGIKPDNIQILGELGEMVSPIGVILKPYVGLITCCDFQLSRDEVAEVFTVPLSFLLSAEPLIAHMEMGNRPQDDFPFELVPHYSQEWKRRRTYKVLFYQYEKHVIWGLTAQVLKSFIDICHVIEESNGI